MNKQSVLSTLAQFGLEWPHLAQGIRVQRRVIRALMLRETKTLFGKHRLGYLWALIQASYMIGIFWLMREFAEVRAPHGMSNPVFLLSGFIPWFIFDSGVSGGLNAVAGNRALLAYPQVFPVDILVARSLLQGGMYLCVFTILLSVAVLFNYSVPIHAPSAVLAGLGMALALGFSAGAVVSSLNLMWPTIGQIVPMVIRVLFFISGLYFSADQAPPPLKDILFYNPITHAIELVRFGLSQGYQTNFVSPLIVFVYLIALCPCGLLLERYSRKYLDENS